jgi:hypothetical protein
MESLAFVLVLAVQIGVIVYLLISWVRSVRAGETPTPLEELSPEERAV